MAVDVTHIAGVAYLKRSGVRTDFVSAWWEAWAQASNKADERYPWGHQGRPSGRICGNSHGSVWLLVTIPVTVRHG